VTGVLAHRSLVAASVNECHLVQIKRSQRIGWTKSPCTASRCSPRITHNIRHPSLLPLVEDVQMGSSYMFQIRHGAPCLGYANKPHHSTVASNLPVSASRRMLTFLGLSRPINGMVMTRLPLEIGVEYSSKKKTSRSWSLSLPLFLRTSTTPNPLE
jgi:hypothetical protein